MPTREQLRAKFPNAPESFILRNMDDAAHKTYCGPGPYGPPVVSKAGPKKRMRQSEKPLMNRLETEFYNRLICTVPPGCIKIQAVTLKIANGLRYTPDFFVFYQGEMRAYETKGAWVDGDSFPKLKMAASVWPEIKFQLWWKDDGEWKEQNILP